MDCRCRLIAGAEEMKPEPRRGRIVAAGARQRTDQQP
jgi:hypothetical protein